MQLYYCDDMVQLWNGDSRQLTPVPDESVHLVFTSPPFWNCSDYGHPDQIGYGHTYEDYLHDLTLTFGECRRCLVPGGRVVAWVADLLEDGRSPRVPLAADTHAVLRQAGLCYDTTVYTHSPRPRQARRPSPSPCAPAPRPGPQHLVVYAKEGTRPEPGPEVRAASRIPPAHAALLDDPVWLTGSDGRLADLGAEGGCPAWPLMRFWTFLGETVLEPFAGAGSFLTTAKKLGRKSVGIEVSESSCAQAAANCRAAVAGSHVIIGGEHADS